MKSFRVIPARTADSASLQKAASKATFLLTGRRTT